ncbi:hypothetical protein M9Y10_004681 [Tritrichomonas musculus]|uniref:Uncharacterized protein n=1 Tax=Tritrichomonas musculus TaxID=1915356 RepID=A0ABR2JJB8_9EUKA
MGVDRPIVINYENQSDGQLIEMYNSQPGENHYVGMSLGVNKSSSAHIRYYIDDNSTKIGPYGVNMLSINHEGVDIDGNVHIQGTIKAKDIINVSTLTTTLNDYVRKDDVLKDILIDDKGNIDVMDVAVIESYPDNCTSSLVSLKMYQGLDTKITQLKETLSNGSNTITHYCPIEESINSINNFVKTIGTWREYIGICVKIDVQKKCIKFANLGDYMIKVDDSSCYGIGDEVFIDNEDNKLKILAGQTAITSKIRRMTVGIVTAIIDDKTLAVFK